MLLSAIHKFIISIWNKEELPDQWKESIVVAIHKKGYKSLYVDEIVGDHQCRFRSNRSINDKIFCILQILEKK
jgi:hypothetical protein